MINKKINTKVIGLCIFIPCVFIFLSIILSLFILTSFGLASGASFLVLLPFFILSILTLVVSLVGVYIAIRYLKNRPFKQNRSLGTLFMAFSFFYFFFSFFSCVISNLTGNFGGWLRPVFAFLILVILLPLGMGLRNGYK
jgi:hypothetical protein